jgi:hypothetical protein
MAVCGRTNEFVAAQTIGRELRREGVAEQAQRDERHVGVGVERGSELSPRNAGRARICL